MVMFPAMYLSQCKAPYERSQVKADSIWQPHGMINGGDDSSRPTFANGYAKCRDGLNYYSTAAADGAFLPPENCCGGKSPSARLHRHAAQRSTAATATWPPAFPPSLDSPRPSESRSFASNRFAHQMCHVLSVKHINSEIKPYNVSR